MLRTDKPIYKAILVLNLILIAAGIVICLFGIFSSEANVVRVLYRLLIIAALIFAAFYIFKGYTKNAAKYFKIFGLLYIYVHLLAIISGTTNGIHADTTVICAVALAVIIFLALSENLGKQKSLICCGLLFAIKIFAVVYTFVMDSAPIASLLTRFVDLDLAGLYGILTYAKYLDKTERGTN